MKKDGKLFEVENRYCPICGNFVKADSSLHRCSDEDLEKINKIEENNDEEIEENRTYDDKLKEFDEYYNSETYYEKEEE